MANSRALKSEWRQRLLQMQPADTQGLIRQSKTCRDRQFAFGLIWLENNGTVAQ